jgi:hypothetical protein
MTQELMVAILLMSFVGLMWLMTIAILKGDHPVKTPQTMISASDGEESR